MTSEIGTHNFAVNGVSKVLMQSNDEAAGDEEAADGLVELDDDRSDESDDELGEGDGGADGGNVCGGYIQKTKTLQKTCRTIGM